MAEYSIFSFHEKLELDSLVRVRFRDGEEAHFPLSMLANRSDQKERITILIPDDEERDIMEVVPAGINPLLLQDHGFKVGVSTKGDTEYFISLNGNTVLRLRPILGTEETRYTATITQVIGKDREAVVQLGQWKYFYFVEKTYTLFTNKKIKWKRALTN